ncbi:MAG TPA: EAL domain-containing protein [Rhodocyclaceae bacterium]|nr:EAL domain-containing protein [Rhodocyclaceae bacterium]
MVALLIGGLISWQLGSLDVQRQRSEARAKVVSELATIRARLEGVFKASFSATEGLVFLIAYQGGIRREVFDALAAQILIEHPTIRHIALAPDNVVRMVYPLKGNEASIGFHYSSKPEQWETVERSRQLRKPLLAGPVDLVQGGRALIIRTPIFLRNEVDADGNGRYWGTLPTVVRLSTLLEGGGLTASENLELSLRGKDAEGAKGDVIYGAAVTFDNDPVTMDVDVPGGEWQLAGIPRRGWPNQSAFMSPYFWFGCFNSILIAGLVGLLVRRRELMRERNIGLMREVEERRQAQTALTESEQRFRQLFESSPDPVWIIENNRFVSCNSVAAAALGYAQHEALLGRTAVEMAPLEQADGEASASKMERMMQLALAQGTHRFEWLLRHVSGRTFPAEITLSAISLQGRSVLYCVWRDISALKRTQAELEHLAHYDALTDLPNRLLFMDRLTRAIERAQRHRHQIAVLLLDLDGFKTVNDSLGHPVGDRLLELVAARLKANVRIEDTVARLGGDEFAIVLAGLADGNDAIEVVRKILEAIGVPFNIDGVGALVTSSIGIAVYPADGDNRDDLIRNADTAMYGAKEAGRNTYRFYQATMTQEAQGRLYLEQALRRAIKQDELEVWYQPQISLSDGHCMGAEALVRWRDPQKGLISPADFIPLAERTGLIVQVGETVIDHVCLAVLGWQQAGLAFGRISINVAGAQITRSDFVATLTAALKRYALPANLFTIEVTETLLMENMERAIEVLEAVKEMGITTAIDDFGTGYSSLAYLKRLPIDTLKIDQAFVQDIPDDHYDMAITQAIIAMGHTLGFTVVAEGVETDEQAEFLRGEGCDEGQGYRYSKPLPEAAFGQWLAAYNAGRRQS